MTCLQGVLREGYLKEMIQVLSDPRYGSNLTQVEATVKKHEAISADILARVGGGTFRPAVTPVQLKCLVILH